MNHITKVRTTQVFISALLLGLPALASAHVLVSPKQVNVATDQTFTVSVPNERDVAVTKVKLALPKGLGEVTPTVHPGWTITKTGDSIVWSGGTVPAGQRDDFSFNSQAPASAGEIDWKAYQTYADGYMVSWDQKPSGSDDSNGTKGPYSVTNVINDFKPADTTSMLSDRTIAYSALVISIAAFFIALLLHRTKRS